MPATPDVRRGHRTWPQRLLITFNVVCMLGALATAGALAYSYNRATSIPRINFGGVLRQNDAVPGEAQNYLLVGVDSSAGMDPGAQTQKGRGNVGGLRSDTIMVVRLDPKSTRARILSLPRDLWVPIAGTSSRNRINTSIETGGPQRLIETIQSYLNIPINHYIQVDFQGFIDLVDAIDGVPVYLPYPVRDTQDGLKLPDPGCHVLKGETALAFARARHYQVQVDGRWRSDPDSDLSRIKRQQFFIERALSRAISKGIRNPRTLNQLVDAGINSVTLDDNLSVQDILKLGSEFRTFRPETLETYTVPVTDAVRGGADVLDLQVSAAQPTLDLFRPGTLATSDELTPENVHVRVLNGTGTRGQAKQVSDGLTPLGFKVDGTGDSPSPSDITTVRFAPNKQDAAVLVARYLDGPVQLQGLLGLEGGVDVEVVTGSGFGGVLTQPRPADEIPTTTAPTTTTTVPDTTAGTGGGGTPTTQSPFIPADPPDGVSCS